ncbi:MAG: hypothetical protein HGA87_00410 [Desulfobulbaceae bacterium]|nr:hypothetical protein [Desulfobulbaceae bacterium]
MDKNEREVILRTATYFDGVADLVPESVKDGVRHYVSELNKLLAYKFLAETPEQIEELKKQIAAAASAGVVVVKFIKTSDGSERVMRCTLSNTASPELAMDRKASAEQGKEPRKQAFDVMPVWEIGVGWRSFKLGAVIEYDFKAN